jgi:Xaa-Pro aminopeptidase
MFDKELYILRRKKLQSSVQSGLILLVGNGNSPMNYHANTFHFRQDSTFLYFFGLDIPNLAGIIDVDNDVHMLFGDDYTLDDILWVGPQKPLAVEALLTGVTQTAPFKNLFEVIKNAITEGRNIHFTPPYRGENTILLSDLLGIQPGMVRDYASKELILACVALRSIKDKVEIDELEKQMEVAAKMHITAMQMAHPGTSEQEITGVLEGISMSAGGMVSFPIICSVRGETLHNHYHGNVLKKGDLLLVDAGSESPHHYATDHTRTIPVGGKFTDQQREVYQIVLNANNAAFAASRPGITYRDVHFIAARTIASGLKEMGIMKGDVDEAVQNGAHALFFPHGLGHMLGLDVHDMEDYNDTLVGYDDEVKRSTQFGLRSLRLGRKLQPGFVVTNEPGIYFIPELIHQWKKEHMHEDFINFSKLEGFLNFGGIRLEDDLLITREGARIMGQRIPIEPEDVEKVVLGR